MKIANKILATLLVATLLLAGCTSSAESISTSSQSATSTTVPPSQTVSDMPSNSSISLNPSASFLNEDFLALIHGTNAQLKALVDENEDRKCYAINIGLMSDALTYYNPYVDVMFASKGTGSWDYDKIHTVELGSIYPANPFTNDMLIANIYIEADLDIVSSTLRVNNQDILRKLFNSDELLTYELISENLNQWPELPAATENSTFQYTPRIEYVDLYEYGEPVTLNGAICSVEYLVGDIDDIKMRVSYLKTEDDYVAYGASLESTDQSWIINTPYSQNIIGKGDFDEAFVNEEILELIFETSEFRKELNADIIDIAGEEYRIYQDNLRLLFNSDELLTYDLISEYSDEWPALSVCENGTQFLNEPTDDSLPHYVLPMPKDVDEYHARYTVLDYALGIRFIKSGDEYIAYSIRIATFDMVV